MNCRYANLTLQGVLQDELIKYLTRLGCKSYVSPTINGFTVMYDLSFEVPININNNLLKEASYIFKYAERWVESAVRDDYNEHVNSMNFSILLQQQDMFDLTVLSPPESARILNHYEGLPEGNLVCWALHLSEAFSCVALAYYLRDDSQFWYHLSKNGIMIDEYSTYAEKDWKVGNPILSEMGREIKGGDSVIICKIFKCEDKANDVEVILRKPYIIQSNYSIKHLDYQTLIDLQGFQNGIQRHQALSMALGMPWEWVIDLSYEVISEGDLSNLELIDITLIKQSKTHSEGEKTSKKSEWNKTVTKYCQQLRKVKSILDYDLEALTSEIERLIQVLINQGQLDHAKVLDDLEKAILQNHAFNDGGKFSSLEYLLVIIDVLIKDVNSKIDEIGYLSFIELSKLMDRQVINPCGQVWKKYRKALASWLRE